MSVFVEMSKIRKEITEWKSVDDVKTRCNVHTRVYLHVFGLE